MIGELALEINDDIGVMARRATVFRVVNNVRRAMREIEFILIDSASYYLPGIASFLACRQCGLWFDFALCSRSPVLVLFLPDVDLLAVWTRCVRFCLCTVSVLYCAVLY
jgi:hypothetical protein